MQWHSKLCLHLHKAGRQSITSKDAWQQSRTCQVATEDTRNRNQVGKTPPIPVSCYHPLQGQVLACCIFPAVRRCLAAGRCLQCCTGTDHACLKVAQLHPASPCALICIVHAMYATRPCKCHHSILNALGVKVNCRCTKRQIKHTCQAAMERPSCCQQPSFECKATADMACPAKSNV